MHPYRVATHSYRVAPHPSNRRRLSTYTPSADDPTTLLRPSASPFYVWPASAHAIPQPNIERLPAPSRSPLTAVPTAPAGALAARSSAPSTTVGRSRASQGLGPPPNRTQVTQLVHRRSRTLEPEESIRIVEDVRPGRRSASPSPLSRRASTAAPVRHVTIKRTPLVILPEASEEYFPEEPLPSRTDPTESSRAPSSQASQPWENDSDDELADEMQEDDTDDDQIMDDDVDSGRNTSGRSRPPQSPLPQPRPVSKGKAPMRVTTPAITYDDQIMEDYADSGRNPAGPSRPPQPRSALKGMASTQVTKQTPKTTLGSP